MSSLPEFDLRRHRDRLLDLLAVGETFPLQDTPLPTQPHLVGFGEPARLPVYHSQRGVRYTLHFEDIPVTRQAGSRRRKVEVLGSGGTVYLETDPIAEDITFDVWATKVDSGRQSRLHQQFRVQVGFDTRLNALIRDLPRLTSSPLDHPPYLARCGQSVTVELEASQEGIDYDLVVLEHQQEGQEPEVRVISTETARGNRQNLPLQVAAVREDIDIRLRATKTVVREGAEVVISDLLDVVLPLRVRGCQNLPVTPLPAVVDRGAPVQIRIDEAQPDVTYRLFARPLVDADFAHGAPAGDGIILVDLPEGEPLPIRFPPAGVEWQPPAGFAPAGEAQGGRETLLFDLPPLERDTLFLIQAEKSHLLTHLPAGQPATTTSQVQLAAPAVLLVRPERQPSLSLKALDDGLTFEIQGGEPGTFVAVLDENEKEAAPPLYFYGRDETIQRYFKGVERFKLGVNLVVDGDREAAAQAESGTQVAPVLLRLAKLDDPREFHLEAVYARSGARSRLEPALQLAPAVTIRPEDPAVPFNGETKIRVVQSRAQETYQLLLNGELLGEPVKGTGRDRLLPTGPLTATTTLQLHVTQPEVTWPVERWLPITLRVLPEADIPFAIVSPGAAGLPLKIQLERSAEGVIYQIWQDGAPFGSEAAGTGAPLLLSSKPLEPPVEALSIRARLAADPDLTVTFSQQIEVNLPA